VCKAIERGITAARQQDATLIDTLTQSVNEGLEANARLRVQVGQVTHARQQDDERVAILTLGLAQAELNVERYAEACNENADKLLRLNEQLASLRALVEPLRALAAQATPGEWTISGIHAGERYVFGPALQNVATVRGTSDIAWANGDLIVAAVNALPALLRLSEPGA
jgi:hypothetical protein